MKINNIFKNKIKGFTLLELIVVIAIIAILAVIALPSFTSSLKKARDARKVADLRTIQSQIVTYAAGQSTPYFPDANLAIQNANAANNAGGLVTAVTWSNGAFTPTGNPTTTLTNIFKAQNLTVPTGVVNGLYGYAVYNCTGTGTPAPLATPPSTVTGTTTTTAQCSNYVLYTVLEDNSNTILSNASSSFGGLLSGANNGTSQNVYVLGN